LEYVQKLSHHSATRTWYLDQLGVHWSDNNGETGRIAYEAIKSVRLRFEPSRAERRRYAMRFLASRNHIITNINYRGMMDFVDQSPQFHKFITSFHTNLHSVNPHVEYYSGSTKGAYIGNLALTLFVLVMIVLAALFFISIGMVWVAGIKVIIILFYLPTLFRLLARNRPSSYLPNKIPPHIFPT
jgi:hypothetical protein